MNLETIAQLTILALVVTSGPLVIALLSAQRVICDVGSATIK